MQFLLLTTLGKFRLRGTSFQALQGHFMTGGGRFIRFQMARGPWTGAHGRELWFDTELADE